MSPANVLGAPNKKWDDRLLCINFNQRQPRALRYGDEILAVGLSSGAVVLYYATILPGVQDLGARRSSQVHCFQTQN